jgi:hypothetical protein
MDEIKRQYEVNQTLIIQIKTDIFDTEIPTAQQIEKEIIFAIMGRNKDIDINGINTTYLSIEDKTR